MEYPRVTEVLRPFSKYDSVPKQTLEKAAERGTAVHALCSAIAKGAWITDGMIPKELVGYIHSFRMFEDKFVEDYQIMEERFTSKQFGYTGQIDLLILDMNKEPVLVDLKTTSTKPKTHRIQLAAYQNLLAENNLYVESAMIVYLDREGHNPQIVEIDDNEFDDEMRIFLSALDCYKYFQGVKNDREAA